MKPDGDLSEVICLGHDFDGSHVRYPRRFQTLDELPMNRFLLGVENHFLQKNDDFNHRAHGLKIQEVIGLFPE